MTSEDASNAFLVAQIISIRGGATLGDVHGVCYVVRQEAPHKVLVDGDVLRDGDLLDLGDDCSLKITSSAQPDVLLRRGNGRFFKLQIKQ